MTLTLARSSSDAATPADVYGLVWSAYPVAASDHTFSHTSAAATDIAFTCHLDGGTSYDSTALAWVATLQAPDGVGIDLDEAGDPMLTATWTPADVGMEQPTGYSLEYPYGSAELNTGTYTLLLMIHDLATETAGTFSLIVTLRGIEYTITADIDTRVP